MSQNMECPATFFHFQITSKGQFLIGSTKLNHPAKGVIFEGSSKKLIFVRRNSKQTKMFPN